VVPTIVPLAAPDMPAAADAGAAPVSAAIAPLTSAANPVGDAAVRAMLADVARSQTGATGAGVRIGILSDSFNVKGGYAADIASGALPAGVTVLQEGPAGSTDEGRAMAELVHAIAPDAQIFFYTAFRSEADFARGIQALADAGCQVIVDDVTYLDEPFFQDGGAVQAAVSRVVATGVSYFTSASNQGTNYYQHGFQGISVKLPSLAGTYLAQNFGTAAQPTPYASLTVARGSTITIDLQWDQPFASIGAGNASANSLGMVLYDQSGRIVAYAMHNDVGGNPSQIMQFTNTTGGTAFRLAIVTNGGSLAPNLLKFIVYGQGATINNADAGIGSGTVIGHEMVAGANTVGAVDARTPGQVESFSSSGPGKLLYDGSGNRLVESSSQDKVNFLAPDGVATSVFSTFYGTSAAAPNAAAVAALMLQVNPTLTPAQVSNILARSAVSASGASGTVGAGMIQATTALQLAAAAGHAQGIAAPVSAATLFAAAMAAQGAAIAAANAAAGAAGEQEAARATAIAALFSDPAARADFTAFVDPADTNVMPNADSLAGGAQSYAMLNNAEQIVVAIGSEYRAQLG
jgi:subtilisin family serine protease